jgi:hypothetical protein
MIISTAAVARIAFMYLIPGNARCSVMKSKRHRTPRRLTKAAGQQPVGPGILRFGHRLRVKFQCHAASKQSVLALIAAGFGVTLATAGQAEVVLPGVVYRPIREDNTWVQVELCGVRRRKIPLSAGSSCSCEMRHYHAGFSELAFRR